LLNSKRIQFILSIIISILVIIIFILYAEYDRHSLSMLSREDGPIENLSAVFFGISCVCFIIFIIRSEFLKITNNRLLYIFPICWAVLMFVFMGEEVSWGQRIFNLNTFQWLGKHNLQNELNVHNIEFVDTFMGGKYRYLSIMMLTTGFLLPVFTLSGFGKRIIQKFAFPVCPLCYSALFVGAYLYGKYYNSVLGNDAAEIREFLLSVGMISFALHGAIFPCVLFRTCSPEKESNR